MSYSRETVLEDKQGLAHTLRAALAAGDGLYLRNISDDCFLRWAQERTYDLHVLAKLARFMRRRALRANRPETDVEGHANAFYTGTILSMIKWRNSGQKSDKSPLDQATTVLFIQQACKGDDLPSLIRALAIARFLRTDKDAESYQMHLEHDYPSLVRRILRSYRPDTTLESFLKALERKFRRVPKISAEKFDKPWWAAKVDEPVAAGEPVLRVATPVDVVRSSHLSLLADLYSFLKLAHSSDRETRDRETPDRETLDIAWWTFGSLVSEMPQPLTYALLALEHIPACFETSSFRNSGQFAARLLTSNMPAERPFYWSESLWHVFFGLVSASASQPDNEKSDNETCRLFQAIYKFPWESQGTGQVGPLIDSSQAVGHGGPLMESSEAVEELLKERLSGAGTTSLWYQLLLAAVIPAEAAHAIVRSALIRLYWDDEPAALTETQPLLDTLFDDLALRTLMTFEFVHTIVFARHLFRAWWVNTLLPRMRRLQTTASGAILDEEFEEFIIDVSDAAPCNQCNSLKQAASEHPSSLEQSSAVPPQASPPEDRLVFLPLWVEDRERAELLETG